MKVRTIICLLLIIAIIGYVIALIGNPLIFIVFSAIASLVSLFSIYLPAANLILKYISRLHFSLVSLILFVSQFNQQTKQRNHREQRRLNCNSNCFFASGGSLPILTLFG